MKNKSKKAKVDTQILGVSVRIQPETLRTIDDLPAGTVSFHWAHTGLSEGEPLLLGMDGLLRYAKAHKYNYQTPLADDGVLGPEFLSALTGLRGLLNGSGAVAMERGMADSKDNGACEAIFWLALHEAGFSEADL